jgi:hypothetical protein
VQVTSPVLPFRPRHSGLSEISKAKRLSANCGYYFSHPPFFSRISFVCFLYIQVTHFINTSPIWQGLHFLLKIWLKIYSATFPHSLEVKAPFYVNVYFLPHCISLIQRLSLLYRIEKRHTNITITRVFFSIFQTWKITFISDNFSSTFIWMFLFYYILFQKLLLHKYVTFNYWHGNLKSLHPCWQKNSLMVRRCSLHNVNDLYECSILYVVFLSQINISIYQHEFPKMLIKMLTFPSHPEILLLSWSFSKREMVFAISQWREHSLRLTSSQLFLCNGSLLSNQSVKLNPLFPCSHPANNMYVRSERRSFL